MIYFNLLSLSFFSYGISVTKIKKAKGLVFIDGGKNDGLNKAQKVCFFDINNKKVACGKIRKLSRKKSLVKVSRRSIKKIKRGFIVRTKEMERLIQKNKDTTFSISSKLSVYYPLIQAYSYNNLVGLETPDRKTFTLFKIEDTGPSGFTFFSGIEVFFSFINLVVGLNFLTLPPKITPMAYPDSSESVSTIYEFSNRIFFDYLLLRKTIQLGLGLQATYHSAILEMSDSSILEGGSDFSTLSYNSNLLTLSLRVPILYELLIKPVGFFFGITPILSLYSLSMGEGLSLTPEEMAAANYPFKKQITSLGEPYLTDPITGGEKGLLGDIKNNLEFNHQIFSLDISLGFFVAF